MKYIWGLLICAVAILAACSPQNHNEPAHVIKAVIETNYGDINIELYPEPAPISVANFVNYAQNRHYKNSSFYRVTNNSVMASGACCTNFVQGGRLGMVMEKTVPEIKRAAANSPYAPIAHEDNAMTGLLNSKGAIGLARFEAGSAISEFYISLTDNPSMDYGNKGRPDGLGYAVFGRVVSGLNILAKLQDQKISEKPSIFTGQMLVDPLIILDIKITN